MSQTANRPAPANYRLRVGGHLDQRWPAWFDDLTLTRERDSTTSFSGAVADQAELHGLLAKSATALRDGTVHRLAPPA